MSAVQAPAVTHVVAGRVVDSSGPLDLDALVLPRTELPPAHDVPTREIVDFLVETGRRLVVGENALLEQALDGLIGVNPLERRVLAHCYRDVARLFEREGLEFELEQALGGADVLDGWRTVAEPGGRRVGVRAFGARTVHVLAGNGPEVVGLTITRGALSKSFNLLKLPSNDLFTATAILRTMADIDPDHPVVRSFSAVYWRGGDEAVERILYRPQFFDKLVVWGGDAAVRNVVKYLGPGVEMIAFDPKVSVSFIGREAHAKLDEVAAAAALDATFLDQEACVASRYQFVEGTVEEVDRYCEALAAQLPRDREFSAGCGSGRPPVEVREEVEVLRQMAPDYGVWGASNGSGLVVRSAEPVGFHPSQKTVNVVPVASLADAVRWVSPATQTVGVFPPSRKAALRDHLATAGAQRVVTLGGAAAIGVGLPHDAMIPLHRLVRWVSDEGAVD
ncbi:MAG TPA: acyl-CoA reductase [Solirubrobacteraceae bacterium]|jgi:hypothetical protein|nr:acyl-CoA reductase [Solirubrobacteraceae bacterium]